MKKFILLVLIFCLLSFVLRSKTQASELGTLDNSLVITSPDEGQRVVINPYSFDISNQKAIIIKWTDTADNAKKNYSVDLYQDGEYVVGINNSSKNELTWYPKRVKHGEYQIKVQRIEYTSDGQKYYYNFSKKFFLVDSENDTLEEDNIKNLNIGLPYTVFKQGQAYKIPWDAEDCNIYSYVPWLLSAEKVWDDYYLAQPIINVNYNPIGDNLGSKYLIYYGTKSN